MTIGGKANENDRRDDIDTDIDIDTELSYMPFVRLALVRHQPKSLDGCTLSPVVLSDIVQTLPHRTLTVIRTPTDTPAVEAVAEAYAHGAVICGITRSGAVPARYGGTNSSTSARPKKRRYAW
jgi:hypothetical protein